jgi:hypothetical protein
VIVDAGQGGALCPRLVRRALRIVNVLVALGTLASALAVLVSDLRVPGYRQHYHDALWFVALYAAVQGAMLVEFARDGRLVPWLAAAKAIAAWLFFAGFTRLWPYWRVWTPARYVYQLFEWGEDTSLGLMALVFLGRGAFNTANAAYFTWPWWSRLRARRPLLGRLATTVLMAAMVLFVWLFVMLQREEQHIFSPEARDVARLVLDGLDCDAVRAHAGETTTDMRQRGDRRYEVHIAYGCALTRVLVRAEDGRIGAVEGPQLECCRQGPS